MNKAKKELSKNTNISIIKNIHKTASEYSINSYADNKNDKNKDKLKFHKEGIKIPLFRNSYSSLKNDFERKYLDKKLLSGNYFKKFFYLDSLATKELSFQKKILDIKDSNSKLYFSDFKKELEKDGKMASEEAYRRYLELSDKVSEEMKKAQIDDYMNKKTDINIFDNSNTVLKVLSKYIHNNKEKRINRIKVYSESYKNIKRNNEDKLLNLNNGIKQLNYIISFKNKKIQ